MYPTYKKRLVTKIVRTQHAIIFEPGCTKGSLSAQMQNIPDWATLKVIETSEDDLTEIIFVEETKEDQPPIWTYKDKLNNTF